LRGVCRKAWGFKSPPEHFLFQHVHTSVDAVFMRVREDLMQHF